jgi:hypothetical protein
MNEYRTFMQNKKEGDFLATCKRLKKEGRKVEAVKLYRRVQPSFPLGSAVFSCQRYQQYP